MDHKIIHAWIFARGGSKGLPGKNILPLKGKPLIAYAIQAAKKSRYIDEIFVSTDSPDIAAVAEQHGAIVPFLRPDSLAADMSPERLSWRHAIEWNFAQNLYPRMDVMVSLPATTPLRTAEEVDHGIELFMKGMADTVIAVAPSDRHPAFNMVYLDENGYASTILGQYEKWEPTRQCFRPAYDITGAFYVTDPDYVMRSDNYLDGRVQSIMIPVEHGIDIDSLMDFQMAELFLQKQEVDQ